MRLGCNVVLTSDYLSEEGQSHVDPDDQHNASDFRWTTIRRACRQRPLRVVGGDDRQMIDAQQRKMKTVEASQAVRRERTYRTSLGDNNRHRGGGQLHGSVIIRPTTETG